MSSPSTYTTHSTAETYVRLAALTDVGQVREHNEDNFLVCTSLEDSNWFLVDTPFLLSKLGSLLVVADGMGGENAGEIASALAIEAIKEYFTALAAKPMPSAGEMPQLLEKAILHAHRSIVEQAHENPDYAGMGTTILIAWIVDSYAYIAWSGDSRCYLFREKEGLKIVSNDHSLVWELVLDGKLDVDEAESHPDSHIITQSLGDNQYPPQPDVIIQEIAPGDKILLCSDGLNGMVNTETLRYILGRNSSPADLCKELIRTANYNGGEDNITVVLLEVLGASPVVDEPKSVVLPQEDLERITGEFRLRTEPITKTYHTQKIILPPPPKPATNYLKWVVIAIGLLVTLALATYLLMQ